MSRLEIRGRNKTAINGKSERKAVGGIGQRRKGEGVTGKGKKKAETPLSRWGGIRKNGMEMEKGGEDMNADVRTF